MKALCIGTLKRWLFDMLVKHVAMPLFKASIDASLKKVMPEIFAEVDKVMPDLLKNATPYQMTKEITGIIGKFTNRSVEPSDLNAIITLFDPIAASQRNSY